MHEKISEKLFHKCSTDRFDDDINNERSWSELQIAFHALNARFSQFVLLFGRMKRQISRKWSVKAINISCQRARNKATSVSSFSFPYLLYSDTLSQNFDATVIFFFIRSLEFRFKIYTRSRYRDTFECNLFDGVAPLATNAITWERVTQIHQSIKHVRATCTATIDYAKPSLWWVSETHMLASYECATFGIYGDISNGFLQKFFNVIGVKHEVNYGCYI